MSVLWLNISLKDWFVSPCSTVDNKRSQLSSLVVCGSETSLVKPLVGARPVKPWREHHAHTLNLVPLYPHITPDLFYVVSRSRGAQLRTSVSKEKKTRKRTVRKWSSNAWQQHRGRKKRLENGSKDEVSSTSNSSNSKQSVTLHVLPIIATAQWTLAQEETVLGLCSAIFRNILCDVYRFLHFFQAISGILL
jgi:hypothetical protein